MRPPSATPLLPRLALLFLSVASLSGHAQVPPGNVGEQLSLREVQEKSNAYLQQAYKLEAAGEPAKALGLYREGRAFCTRWYGPDHAWTAMMEAHAANACLNLGDIKGWPLIDHALPILLKTYGPGGELRYQFVHGYLRCVSGSIEEGVAEMEHALVLLQKSTEVHPTIVLEQAARMTGLCHLLRKWKQAHTAARLTLQLTESIHGKEAATNAWHTRKQLADGLYGDDRPREAIAIYAEIVPKMRKQPVADASVLGTAYLSMLTIYSCYTEKALFEAVRQDAEAYADEYLHTPDLTNWKVYLLDQLGMLHASEGQYGKARLRYQQAVAAAQPLNNRRLLLIPLHGLAYCDYREGHSAKAIAQDMELLKMAEEFHDLEIDFLATVECSLASIYNEMRDPIKALPHARRSLELARQSTGKNASTLLNAMTQVGTLEKYAGNTPAALKVLKEGSALSEKYFNIHPIECLSLIDTLSYVLRKQGDSAEARLLLERTIPLGIKMLGADHDSLAQLHGNLSICYRDLHQNEEASVEAARALAIKERTSKGQWDGMANDFRNLMAYTTWNSGSKKEAEELARQSIPSCLARFHHMLSFTSENQRRALVMNLTQEDLTANFGMAEETAKMVLNTKGMVMESLMRDMRSSSLSKDPAMISALAKLRALKAGIREMTGKQHTAENTSSALKSAQEELEQSEQALFSLLKRDAPQILETAQVASALPPGSALLDWFHYRWHPKEAGSGPAYGLVVYQPGKKPALYHLGRVADLDAEVADFFASLTVKGDKDAQIAAAKLLTHLLGNAADSLADVKTLYLCPDEALHLVPFAILPDDKGRLFGERFSLRQLTSARDALVSTSTLQPSGTVSIFADPKFAEKKEGETTLRALPGTRVEALTLEKMAHDAGMQCNTVLGADATKAALRSLNSPGILHLGTHGYFHSTPNENLPDQVYGGLTFGLVSRLDQPMERSGIALADVAGAANDCRLSASEAAELNLTSTWLVCIGACNTAMGSLRSGDGVASIQRGFQVAGARHVMAPMWPVGDKITAEFMTDFYHDIFAGKTASDALLNTQMRRFRILEKEEGYRSAVFNMGGWLLVSTER